MWYVSAVLFVLGFAAYIIAAFNVGNNTGETFSDIGNACMLTSVSSIVLWTMRPGRAPAPRAAGSGGA
jgi:hypothetical protein